MLRVNLAAHAKDTKVQMKVIGLEYPEGTATKMGEENAISEGGVKGAVCSLLSIHQDKGLFGRLVQEGEIDLSSFWKQSSGRCESVCLSSGRRDTEVQTGYKYHLI